KILFQMDEGVFDSGCSRSITDTECLVLSKDFKLPDESMVVLRVPKKHNIYTINLNNLCPRGNLACLVAHASVDESVKWHRRMVHVNYKNVNRLVKVRTACYVLNRVLVTSPHNKTPHALLTGNIPSENPFPDAEDEGVFDSGCSRSITDTECLVLSKDFKLPDESMVVLRVPKKHNIYTINLNNLCPRGNLACLVAHASVDEYVKWHRRMVHVNYKNMNRLVKGNLVRGLPPKLFKHGHTCVACCKEHKDETYPILKDFINLVENQLNKKVKAIRCDNGIEFKNAHIIELCGSKGRKREYSNARIPQQNRVAERKSLTLIEAARTMLADSKLSTMFWTEAVRTACYVLNRVLVTSPHNKTPHALLTGNIPSASHFKPFGCHVTILNTSDHLYKFDGKADEGYIVGYSASNKVYKLYNVPNKRVEETINLRFLKENPNELARLTGQEQRTTFDAESLGLGFANDDEELSKRESAKTVPPGGIPVPTSSIPVPSGDTMGVLSMVAWIARGPNSGDLSVAVDQNCLTNESKMMGS
nr:hypothetical protein [Tanacetum cinerariifolium]